MYVLFTYLYNKLFCGCWKTGMTVAQQQNGVGDIRVHLNNFSFSCDFGINMNILNRFYMHFEYVQTFSNLNERVKREVNSHTLPFPLQQPLPLWVIDTQIKSRHYASTFPNTGTWEVSISLLLCTCKYQNISLWWQSCVGRGAVDLMREGCFGFSRCAVNSKWPGLSHSCLHYVRECVSVCVYIYVKPDISH